MPDRPDVPPKLFFRIGEVAGLVGVEPHVLRYWEREFRSIRPTKSAKGQRVYSRKDVENLLRVRDLLYRDGFTIAGAKKKLQRGDAAPDGVVARAFAPQTEAEPRIMRERIVERASSEAPVVAPAPVTGFAPPGFAGSVTGVAPPGFAGSVTGVAPPGFAGSVTALPVTDPRVREKLTALRVEVEAFLAELSKKR